VGTFFRGFDELVAAADAACQELALPAMAQIGHSSVVPRHVDWVRFLPEPRLREFLRAADIVVCHGGMGILGEAMRARRPVIAVPRRGSTSAANPANDQHGFLLRLAQRLPIHVCERPGNLVIHLRRLLATGIRSVDYDLASDVPQIITDFLTRSAPVAVTPSRRPRHSHGDC
jgi:UDP-N-acetylglucosamine transferase subunit ALG13